MYLFVIGTRPEAIKMAPIILEFKRSNKDTKVLLSGQHRDMVKEVLSFFDIKYDFDFNIMKDSQTTSYILWSVIKLFEETFRDKKIDCLFVHGDTTTALASALWGFQNNIPIIHVEAGLRTSNINEPFPEESNRRIISQISTISFCPTNNNKKNLLKENNKSKKYVVGNSVIDAVKYILKNFKINNKVSKFRNIKYILFTMHRRENLKKENISNVIKFLKDITKDKNLKIIFPIHPNPKVREMFKSLMNIENIYIIEPMDYQDFIYILSNSEIIITDSGGLQEEATYLKKPLIILRNETEREEIKNNNYAFLTGCNYQKMINAFHNCKYKNKKYDNHIFGNGTTSKKILKIIEKEYEI